MLRALTSELRSIEFEAGVLFSFNQPTFEESPIKLELIRIEAPLPNGSMRLTFQKPEGNLAQTQPSPPAVDPPLDSDLALLLDLSNHEAVYFNQLREMIKNGEPPEETLSFVDEVLAINARWKREVSKNRRPGPLNSNNYPEHLAENVGSSSFHPPYLPHLGAHRESCYLPISDCLSTDAQPADSEQSPRSQLSLSPNLPNSADSASLHPNHVIAQPSLSSLPPANCLVVDDNPICRRLHALLCRSLDPKYPENAQGREMTSFPSAQSGNEALEILRKNPEAFDFILLDLNMENGNGFETIQAIRKDPSLQTLVVVTITANEDQKMACLEAGFDFYLPKGIKMNAFRKAIADLAEQIRAQRIEDPSYKRRWPKE